MNLNYLADLIGSQGVAIGHILSEMAKGGSSVLLNWGEDDNLWECSWITSGVRFTAFEADAETAVRVCAKKVIDEVTRRRNVERIGEG